MGFMRAAMAVQIRAKKINKNCSHGCQAGPGGFKKSLL